MIIKISLFALLMAITLFSTSVQKEDEQVDGKIARNSMTLNERKGSSWYPYGRSTPTRFPLRRMTEHRLNRNDNFFHLTKIFKLEDWSRIEQLLNRNWSSSLSWRTSDSINFLQLWKLFLLFILNLTFFDGCRKYLHRSINYDINWYCIWLNLLNNTCTQKLKI